MTCCQIAGVRAGRPPDTPRFPRNHGAGQTVTEHLKPQSRAASGVAEAEGKAVARQGEVDG
jgi:hypothetical protein